MKVLITSARDNLAGQTANSLGDDHEILLTDREDVSTRFPFVRSDLNHTAPTNDLVRGVDVIVHSGAVDPRASISDQLDYQMRCTYNLLKAAWEEGVPRVVSSSARCGSWKATTRRMQSPSVGNRRPRWSRGMSCACHLGEIVCREFARERKTRGHDPEARRNHSSLRNESLHVGPLRGRRDRGGKTEPERRSLGLARHIPHSVGRTRRQVPDRPAVAERGRRRAVGQSRIHAQESRMKRP